MEILKVCYFVWIDVFVYKYAIGGGGGGVEEKRPSKKVPARGKC